MVDNSINIIYYYILFSSSWSFLWWWWNLGCMEQNNRAPAIPKFGTWDVTDPNSGEGYTAIFNKIKEERQIKSANITNTPTLNKSNIQNQYAGSFSWFSKVITSYMLICYLLLTFFPHHFSSTFNLYWL